MNRVAFVTGGSRGIGLATVRALRSEGWAVAACSRSKSSTRRIPADYSVACDVLDPKAVSRAIAGALRALGRIDLLVNNAGVAGTNSLKKGSDDRLWHKILSVNLNGTYYFSKQLLPHLPDGAGRIVNVASVLALRGVPDQTAYCAAKHGVLGFTRALALHLAPRRITVNAVCPGWVRTDMAKQRMRNLRLPLGRLEAGVPLGRFVEPEEVARLILYLASPAAAAITGQAFTIDGGSLA